MYIRRNPPDRVDDAAQAIFMALVKLLDRRNTNSPVNLQVRHCRAYHEGLTNGEDLIARLIALSRMQEEIAAELAGLQFGDADDDKSQAA